MKTNLILCCSLVVSLGACVDTAAPDDVDSTDFTDQPKLAINGITPTMMFNNAMSPNILNATALSTMAATADGRSVGAYYIACALASGHNVTTSYTDSFGTHNVTFNGAIGLGDSWTSGTLSTAQQEIVSSCMLSRMNENGVNVNISIRGNSSALNSTSQELSSYTLQEGAFFGNVFLAVHQGWYVGACKGSGTAPSTRQCAQAPNLPDLGKCGLIYSGLCSNICTWDSNGYFTGCNDGTTTWSTPVTVYLVP